MHSPSPAKHEEERKVDRRKSLVDPNGHSMMISSEMEVLFSFLLPSHPPICLLFFDVFL